MDAVTQRRDESGDGGGAGRVGGLPPGGQFRGQSGQAADLAPHGSVVDLESQ
jgi:hypothetical protein